MISVAVTRPRTFPRRSTSMTPAGLDMASPAVTRWNGEAQDVTSSVGPRRAMSGSRAVLELMFATIRPSRYVTSSRADRLQGMNGDPILPRCRRWLIQRSDNLA